ERGAVTTSVIPIAATRLLRTEPYEASRSRSRKRRAVSHGNLRQEQARRSLEKLQAYLQEQRAAALPKSPLGAAIGYALRNWVALTRYAEDGRLKIDNNGAEQALRPIGFSLEAKRPPIAPPSCVRSCRP